MAERGRDIQVRTFRFAARIIQLVKALPKDISGLVVARQLARAGMSVGANVEEAQGAQSKTDFARKMNISLSEAREALYWLRLIGETNTVPASRLGAIIKESDEIVKILTTIVKRCRERREGKAN